MVDLSYSLGLWGGGWAGAGAEQDGRRGEGSCRKTSGGEDVTQCFERRSTRPNPLH